MPDTVTLTRDQVRLLIAGVAVASGALALVHDSLAPNDFLSLLHVFLGRLRPDDQDWLMELATQVEDVPPPAPPSGGVWH